MGRPDVQFTGRSILTVDRKRELFTKHVDEWDSVVNNQYFSLEGLQDLVKQLINFQITPDLDTPHYVTLNRYADFEIRKYESFSVAETAINDAEGLASGYGFNTLASYLFG